VRGSKVIACAILVALSTSLFAAQKKRPPAKRETLACRLGTEDRHARIAVVLVGGKMSEFAYYSKWKPRTCSIYLQRNDAHSKWKDNGAITTVSLERGAFMIEHKPGVYHIIFRDIDRERYCGMDGTINGSLTIRKGDQSCQLEGIMEEGTALGQAYVKFEQSPPALLQEAETAASGAQPDPSAAEQTARAPVNAAGGRPNCGPVASGTPGTNC
jgi:hypothetical protein